MYNPEYTIRKLINGAILIPAVLIAILAAAYFDLNAVVTIVIAVALTAGFVLLIRKWTLLDRTISKNTYTIWNIVIIAGFVIAYYTLRTNM